MTDIPPPRPDPCQAIPAGTERLGMERIKGVFPVNAVFGVALAMLIGVGWFGYRNTVYMAEASHWEDHSYAVLRESDGILSILKDAETGQRGFLITGDEKYLKPYLRAISRVSPAMASLKELTRDNPVQEKRLHELEPVVAEKLAELKRTIEVRRAEGFDPARQIVVGNLGRALMDDIRTRMSALGAEEERLLQKRAKNKADDTHAMLQTGAAGGLLAVSALVLAFWFLRKEVAQRTRAEGQVRHQRDHLEELVKGRTAELAAEVADHKRAEKALQMSEDRLRFALESCHIGAWDLDLVGYTAFRSLEHDRIFGYPELLPEWTYEMFLNHVLPEDRAAVDAKFQAAITTQGDWNLECRIRRADGEVRWIWATGRHRTDAAGGMCRMAGVVQDITARKQAEEVLKQYRDELETRVRERTAELRENQQRFSSMLEGVRDYAIIFLTPDGRVTTWNKGAEQIKGYQADEIVGQSFSRFYLAEDIAAGRPEQELRTTLAEGRFEEENWRVRKDGSRYWASVVMTALRDADGKVNGVVKITRDLTARKQAETEIRSYAADLQRSNRELEHFAYVASHDLQEPLRAVGSFSELLAKRYHGKLDDDADEFLTFIVDGAKRMQDLINDLLAFSRIGTRGQPFTRVKCEEILQTARRNLDVSIAESGAIITHDPLPELVADQGQLTQLLQNLLGNAIKFRRPGVVPCIHVSAIHQDAAWQFSVRDNGIGILPEYFDRIFILFQRLHGRDAYPGTGIGLAICMKIVERQGGRLWVESAPESGSTFHFTIPDNNPSS